MTDQTQIGGFSAFFVISVVKNPFTFGIPGAKRSRIFTAEVPGNAEASRLALKFDASPRPVRLNVR